MKRYIFIVLFSLLTINGLFSQSGQPAAKDSIKFDKTTFDYGTIAQGSSGLCEFKFINTGKSPIVLSNVTASCGCTTPEWPKNPVKPGEAGTVKVKYNTQIIGHFGKTITVFSNAVNSPVVLQILGEVKPN